MKKIMILFAILITLVFSSCSYTSDPVYTSGSNEELVSLYRFTTYSSYKNFVTEGYKTVDHPLTPKQLPENFVTWEQASVFGEVEYLSLDYDYSRGHYSIRDENGESFLLYVDFMDGKGSGFVNPNKVVTIDITRTKGSMRTVAASDNAMRILKDEFEYYYIPKGVLLHITWRYNGVQFTLAGDLDSYTVKKAPTIISYLLAVSDETAKTAFTQIRQTFSK